MVYSCSGAEQEYTMVWFGIFLYLLISSLKIRFCEQSVFAKSPLTPFCVGVGVGRWPYFRAISIHGKWWAISSAKPGRKIQKHTYTNTIASPVWKYKTKIEI